MMRTFMFVVVAILAGAASAAERSASMLSYACAGCHGTAGASAGDSLPILAGLPREYLSNIMLQYKNGERYSTIMGRIARGYSDAEIDAMAIFFEKQKWVSAVSQLDPKMIARGKELHEQKCVRCHLGNGQYTEYLLPRIGGQWSDYLTIYLKNVNTSEFKQPQPQLMKESLSLLTDEELAALAQFYAAQQ
ncbi:MAG: cytochrome c, class I [Gammaproteobacteria bacterium]|nr:MAG: cytochrome c, class I [Gammaproteobacteria bacterium]RKZ72129.1 MAG: cytochrome c, class I [Gammaproteobacteria bacterium]